jgi:hypothetical protein
MSVNVAAQVNGIFQTDYPNAINYADPSVAAGPQYLVETTGLSILIRPKTGSGGVEQPLLDFFAPLKPGGTLNGALRFRDLAAKSPLFELWAS